MHALSLAARLYTLRELSRRAGVTPEIFTSWKIETGGDSIVVRPGPESIAEVRFPAFAGQADKVVRKSWAREAPPSIRELVPDFVVPFCRRDSIPGEPLFRETEPGSFECTEDLLDSALRTLSRFEEIDSPHRDTHGRFPASASIAFQQRFLDRPIVDEYGLALQQVLRILSPGWQPRQQSLQLKLTHDIDQAGIPFSLRGAAGHLLKRHVPSLFARDLLSLISGVEPGYLSLVRVICSLSLNRGIHSALYWKASPRGPFDTGYDLTHRKIASVIEWAYKQGVEMGTHPGYDTFRSRSKLTFEVERCRKVLMTSRIGGRQHYLRWCPETWADWEDCGLSYDSTVGFADVVGFRAGTCVPYRPWLYAQNRVANLLEIPLIVMDATLVDYMKLSLEQSIAAVKNLLARCSVVGGVFAILWHNTSLLPPFSPIYPRVLDTLTGIDSYDWQADPRS